MEHLSRNDTYYQRAHDAMEIRVEALTNANRQLVNTIERLERDIKQYKRAGEFYLRMQNHIKNNENVRAAWVEFYTMYALIVPDINELK